MALAPKGFILFYIEINSFLELLDKVRLVSSFNPLTNFTVQMRWGHQEELRGTESFHYLVPAPVFQWCELGHFLELHLCVCECVPSSVCHHYGAETNGKSYAPDQHLHVEKE